MKLELSHIEGEQVKFLRNCCMNKCGDGHWVKKEVDYINRKSQETGFACSRKGIKSNCAAITAEPKVPLEKTSLY